MKPVTRAACVAGLVLAGFLAVPTPADAQYYYRYGPRGYYYRGPGYVTRGYYDPYTGRYYSRSRYYNPYRGRVYYGRSYYSPYYGRYGRTWGYYNPYTGRYGYRYYWR
jgi:hypothetical protein